MIINLAINYGGRDEITTAARKIAQKVKTGEIQPEDIDEQMIDENLYTAGQPQPDMILRPSGEYRLSNFLLWQAAYAELYFTDTLWPDFDAQALDRAITDFYARKRRYGGI